MMGKQKKKGSAAELPGPSGKPFDTEAPKPEKKRSREEISASEEKYRLIVEKANQGIFVAQDGKLQFFNNAIAKVSAYSQNELNSQPFVNFIHPDDREMVLGNYQKRIRGEAAPQNYSFRVIDRNGKIRWLELRSIEIIWNDRPATLNFIDEITKRKAAEDAQRKSEERFKQVAENAGEWIWEVDVNGLYTYSSPVVEEILGYKPEELVGKKYFYDLFSPEKRESLKRAALEFFQKRKTLRRFVNSNIHKKGNLVYLETSGAPIVDGEGNLLGYRGVDTDITEQRQTEELYRTVTESSQIGIYIIQDGKFQFVNSRFREYFQFDSDEILENAAFRVIHPEDREKVRENAINMLKGRLSSSYEFRIIDGDGKTRWLLEKVTPISYEGKRAVLGNAVDISDRKQAEDAQSRSEEEARRLAKESSLLAEIGRIISSTLNIEEVYEVFSEKVKNLIPYDRIVINLLNKDGTTLVNRYVEGDSAPGRNYGEVFPLRGTLTEMMLRERKGVILDSENEGEIAARCPGLVPEMKAGSRSFLSVPLISRDQPIGGLHFRSHAFRAYSEKDLRLGESIAAQIAGAIANAQLFSELKSAESAFKRSEQGAKQLAQENAIMAEIGEILCSTLDIRSVYARFSETVRKLIPFDRMAINIPNLENKTFMIPYVSGIKVVGRREGDNIPLGGTIVEEVIRTRSSILVRKEDLKDYLRRFPGLSVLAGSGFSSMLSVPLISKDRVIGILNLQLATGGSYRTSDLQAAEKVGSLIAGAIENAQLFAERQQAEEKYRTLVQNANDAIFIIQDGVIKFSNRKTEKLFGYSERELAAIPFSDHIHPADREKVGDGNLEKPRQSDFPKPPSFRIRNKSGLEFWVELKSVDIEWDTKPATLNFASDITEQKKLEAQFLQAQKMEAVGRLAGGVAHDFNNLLTVINTNSQLALMDLKEWDPLREKFESIQTAGERAANLTRQLLAFSRRQIVEMKVISLNTILRDLEKMLRRLIGEDIILTSILDGNLGRVRADAGQIEQVIFNLVVNARDAMPKGGKLTIETANVNLDQEYTHAHMGVKPGPYVMLSVSDNGVGMEAEVRERIFEPFFTTKEKGRGTGLGLSTVYGIIKQTGGEISFYSEPGQGTTFKIYLPQVDEPLEGVAPKAKNGEVPSGHETILVVEDEEGVRKLAVEILNRQGYKVMEASHGAAALLLCEESQEPIHLLLSDVVMPEISGPDFARRLKFFRPEIKVLFMSGFPDNALLQHGILDRGVYFLQKPFSMEGLAKKVREVLDGS